MVKLQLILPNQEERFEQILSDGWWMPLGLFYLATYVKKNEPSTEIEILDGVLTNQKTIEDKIGADIVGISPTIISYPIALRYAKLAKKRNPNSKVLFGGHYVTSISELILKKRPEVDYTVNFDGEHTLLEVVKGTNPNDIPNLVFRERGRVISNSIIFPELDNIPFPDFELIGVDVKPYFKMYKQNYPDSEFYNPITINTQRGCAFRAGWKKSKKPRGCLFCARTQPNWRSYSPQKVWDYLQEFEKSHNLGLIAETSDDFLSSLKWFREFHSLKPSKFNIPFRMYIRPDKITKETAKMLKELNCSLALLGYETGDDKMMKICGKGFTTERSIEASKLLHQHGICETPAYLLGLPGESHITIQRTIEHARKVTSNGAETIFFSLFTPLPGARAWDMMMQVPEFRAKYGDTDKLDPIEMQKDWINYFCNVTFDEILSYVPEITKLAPYAAVDYWPKKSKRTI
ncbi:B12-binding domain-containing radical SAM protein [Bacteroidota bacterium]